MKHQNYYPIRVAEQVLWLDNFASKIGGYTVVLNLEATDVDAIVLDSKWLIYVLGSWLPGSRSWGQACTQAASTRLPERSPENRRG